MFSTMEPTISIPPIPDPRSFTILMITLFAITWVAVALRCWTRLKIVKRWGWDDTTILFCAVRDHSLPSPLESILTDAKLTYTTMTGLGLAIIVHISKQVALPFSKVLVLVNVNPCHV